MQSEKDTNCNTKNMTNHEECPVHNWLLIYTSTFQLRCTVVVSRCVGLCEQVMICPFYHPACHSAPQHAHVRALCQYKWS